MFCVFLPSVLWSASPAVRPAVCLVAGVRKSRRRERQAGLAVDRHVVGVARSLNVRSGPTISPGSTDTTLAGPRWFPGRGSFVLSGVALGSAPVWALGLFGSGGFVQPSTASAWRGSRIGRCGFWSSNTSTASIRGVCGTSCGPMVLIGLRWSWTRASRSRLWRTTTPCG